MSCWMPSLNDYYLLCSLVYSGEELKSRFRPPGWAVVPVTLPPCLAPCKKRGESIAHIRACSRHISREVILSEPQAVEVAQHLLATEQSLCQASSVLSAQLNAIAEQLRAAQMALLLGRQHERSEPSDSSVVSGSVLPDSTSFRRVEGSDCDTVKGEIDHGHSYDGTVVRGGVRSRASSD